jgi:hypothetical protein
LVVHGKSVFIFVLLSWRDALHRRSKARRPFLPWCILQPLDHSSVEFLPSPHSLWNSYRGENGSFVGTTVCYPPLLGASTFRGFLQHAIFFSPGSYVKMKAFLPCEVQFRCCRHECTHQLLFVTSKLRFTLLICLSVRREHLGKRNKSIYIQIINIHAFLEVVLPL